MPISPLQFALRLLLAIILGSCVGFERQWRQRMAGTRTNALVAAGASAFVMSGFLLRFGDASAGGRIVSYVVSGVGFLGAGVIFKDGANVRGLNTAATVWCCAAIGVLAGLGAPAEAVILSAGILFTNLVLRPLAHMLQPVMPTVEPVESVYELELQFRAMAEGHIRSVLIGAIKSEPLSLLSMDSIDSPDGSSVIMRAEVAAPGQKQDSVERIVSRLSIEEELNTIRWKVASARLE